MKSIKKHFVFLSKPTLKYMYLEKSNILNGTNNLGPVTVICALTPDLPIDWTLLIWFVLKWL